MVLESLGWAGTWLVVANRRERPRWAVLKSCWVGKLDWGFGNGVGCREARWQMGSEVKVMNAEGARLAVRQ